MMARGWMLAYVTGRVILIWVLAAVLLWVLDANLRSLISGADLLTEVVPNADHVLTRLPFLVSVYAIALGMYILGQRERYRHHVRMSREFVERVREDMVVPMEIALTRLYARVMSGKPPGEVRSDVLGLLAAQAYELRRVLDELTQRAAPEEIERAPGALPPREEEGGAEGGRPGGAPSTP